jgi:tetratricopeptide (TPR) repeat protein
VRAPAIAATLLLLAGVARADDLDLARKLVARGLYEPAESLAHGVARPEARVVEAEALAGRARIEKAPALLAAAGKLLAEADKKGVVAPRDLLTRPAAIAFGTPEEEVALMEALRSSGRIGAAEALIEAAIPGARLEGAALRRARTIKAGLLGERSRHPELGGDAASRARAFDEARALFQDLARSGTTDDEVYEARSQLDDLCVRWGQGLLEASRKAEDDAAREALTKESREAFAAAASFLDAEVTRLRGDMAGPGAALAESCVCAASSARTRCLVGRGRAAATRAEREPLLREALKALDEFNAEFSNAIEGYESAIDMAEVHVELGELAEAEVALESAFNVALPGARLTRPELEVFARAALVSARLEKRTTPERKLVVLDKALAHAKACELDLEKDPLARILRIERASVLATAGKEREALAELEKIAALEPAGPVAELARSRILRIHGVAASESLSSAEALELMEKALGQGAFPRAASLARMALAAGGKDARVAAQALLGLARSYEARARYYEASIAYEEVTRRAANDAHPDVVSSAALGLVKCCEAARHGASAFDDEACAHALAVLSRVDAAAGRSLVPFHRGRKLEDERRYAEAADEFAKVLPEAQALHDEALYAGAWCRFQAAREQRGNPEGPAVFLALEASLVDTLAAYAGDPGTEERRKRRHELEAEVRFLLADVLLKNGAPARVLALLEKADPARSPGRIGSFRVEAHLALGDLGAAEAELDRLVAGSPEEPKAALACRDVAQALDRAAREKPAPERRAIRARAARLYSRWIELGRASGEARPRTIESLHAAHALLGLGLDVSGLDDRTLLLDLDPGWSPGQAATIFTDARDLFAACMKVASDPTERSAGLACWGEAAGLCRDWASAVSALDQLVSEAKLLDASGEIDPAVVKQDGVLLLLYADLAVARLELGATVPGEAEKGFRALDKVVAVSPRESRLWWKARVAAFEGLERRGTQADLQELACALRSAERSYPGFLSAERFGLVPRLKALQAKVAALAPSASAGGNR